MKKLFIAAVLIAALGGALYYFFEMRKTQSQNPVFKSELIGAWTIDSVALSAKDSGSVIAMFALAFETNFLKYTYEFKQNGSILKKLGDSTLTEKISYQLKDSASILINENDEDSESFKLKFTEKQTNSFVLMDKDSTVYFFKRKQ